MKTELPKITEAEFQQQVIDMAGKCGWKSYHTHDSRRSNPGFPDLVLVRGSRCIFVECKREDGKVSPEQKEWLEALANCHHGVEAFVWRPGEWREIESVITGQVVKRKGLCRFVRR